MSNTSYNGWTNRATWLVNVWFNPESRDDVEVARYAIEEAEDALPDFMKDFLCTSEINWDELLEHFDEEETDLEEFFVDLIEEGHTETIIFECMAEDKEHAKEQAENAYPNCKVVSIV